MQNSQSERPVTPHRGPSPRRRSPVEPRLFAPVLVARSSSSSLDGTDSPSFLDNILDSMTRIEKRRSSFGAVIRSNAAVAVERAELERDARRATDAVDSLDCLAERRAWKCRLCNTSDQAALQLAHDKSSMVCAKCGATDGSVNLTDNQHEKTTGYTQEATLSAGALVTATTSTAERKRVRDVLACASSVGDAQLKRVQTGVSRKVAATIDADSTLSASHLSKRDAAIVHIHSYVTKAGRNPDSCPFYRRAAVLANRAFVKACAHQAHCTSRSAACPGFFSFRQPQSIACIALCAAIDEASDAVAESEEGACFFSLDERDVADATAILNPMLSSFKNNATLYNSVSFEFASANKASADAIARACELPDSPATPIPSTPAPTGSYAEWCVKLKASLACLSSVGMLEQSVLESALELLDGFQHRSKLAELMELPNDASALIVATAVAGDVEAVRTAMASVCGRHGVDIATATAFVEALTS